MSEAMYVHPTPEQMLAYVQHLASKPNNVKTIMDDLDEEESTARTILEQLSSDRLQADSFTDSHALFQVIKHGYEGLFKRIGGRTFYFNLPSTFTMDRGELSTDIETFNNVLNGTETGTDASFSRYERLGRSPVGTGPAITGSPISPKLFEEIQSGLRLGFVACTKEADTSFRKTLRLFVEGWGAHEKQLEKRPIAVDIITLGGYNVTARPEQLHVMEIASEPHQDLRAHGFMLAGLMVAKNVYPLGHGGFPPWPTVRMPVKVMK